MYLTLLSLILLMFFMFLIFIKNIINYYKILYRNHKIELCLKHKKKFI